MDGPGQIRQGGDAAGAARRALATPHKLAGAQPEPPSRAARAWGGAGGGGPPADEETPVRSYESYSKLQQHATEELGEAAQSLLGAGEHGEGAALEQEMEERLSSGRLQSLQCQLEVQRQTSAKLAKMCKENKEEYEACVQRLAEESEAERLRAHAVEQELHKRIHTLESAGRGRGYVSIHGFSAGTAKREAEKKEEYLDHLETDTARLKQKVADLTAKLSKANVRGVKAETQLEKSRSEHRAALDSMRQAQVELQNRLEDKDTLIQALRNEAETRVWGVDKIREQYRGLELDRARLQGEVEELKVGAAQHEGELAQAQAQLHKLQHAGAELEEKNATLRRQLEDAVARARQVEGQLLNARKGDDELLHENRCLSSKLATVTFQYEELERALNEIHARHKAQDQEALSKMQRQHLESRNRVHELESELQASQIELKRTKTLMHTEIANLQAKNASLEDWKTSEQAESARSRTQLAQTHAEEVAVLREQHATEIAMLRVQLRAEMAERDREREGERVRDKELCEREAHRQTEMHQRQLGDLEMQMEKMKAELEDLQRKLVTSQAEAADAQRQVAVVKAEKEVSTLTMAQTAEERDSHLANLRNDHQKRVDDLLAQLTERDGKISELHNKVEQLHGTLLEMRHKNQTSEAEVQVHSSKAADMARRIHALEENKAKLESTCETASRKQHELEAKVRLSEGQRSTLEVSVLQMTETISALSSQITDLETRTSAEAQRVSSLEIKLSLETDARIRAEELAVEAVRWKEDQGQYQWDAQGGNRSLEQDEDSEIKSLRKMVLHLESRIAEKDAEHTSAKHSQVQQQVASLERQLASYQDQAKHWETLRQQLCTRIAQLEGKHSASTASQQHDAVQARKFEILATQRAEENTGLRRQMAEVEELLAKQRLEGDTLLKRVAVAEDQCRALQSECEMAKRALALEQAKLKKCQADLQVAEDKATQAVRAKEELQHEKERLSRANGQLAGELGVFRMKIGHAAIGNATVAALNASGASRKSLYASALGVEGDLPSFRDISREIRNISPASAYHASVTGSHLGNELSNVSDSSVLEHSTSAGRGEIHKVQQEMRTLTNLVHQLYEERKGEGAKEAWGSGGEDGAERVHSARDSGVHM